MSRQFGIALLLVPVMMLTACKDETSTSSAPSSPASGGIDSPGLPGAGGLPSAGGLPAPPVAGVPSGAAPTKQGAIGNDPAKNTAANSPGKNESSKVGSQQTPSTADRGSNPVGVGTGNAGGLSDDDYDVGPELEDVDFDVDLDGLPGLEGSGGGSVLGDASEAGRGGPGGSGSGDSLDVKFETSLDVFDGIILAGQSGAVGMETAGGSAGLPGMPGQSGSAGGKSGSGSSAGGASGGGQESRIPPPPSGSQSSSGSGGGGETAPGGSSRSGGNPGQDNTNSIPDDIPDGDDDDLVARQLREAAEREQDPELRDKLWDEYRKYKGG